MKLGLTLARRLTVVATLAVLFALPTALFGQSATSSALTGRVTDDSGALAAATVTAIHLPTGATRSTTTRENGRFNLSGLRPGGPYTITASSTGYQVQRLEGIYLQVSDIADFTIELSVDESEVIQLDEFTVSSDQFGIIDPTLTGPGTSFGSRQISSIPQTRRDFHNIAKNNLYATISNDRGRNRELSVAGQGNRMNSILVDGVRINDQFGLASSGVQSLRNPVSLESIESISVDVSPYDVRQSGFTGAAINAVTKSGTNEFSGSIYWYYFDDNLRGDDPDGDNFPIEENTYGFTFGGPIIKDTLFFFINYEDFEQVLDGARAGFTPDPDALAELYAHNASLGLSGLGEWAAPDQSVQSDEKSLVKIDWQINEDHRLAVKWQLTEGVNPTVANYDDFNRFSPETALNSHFYTQLPEETFTSLQLYSTWADNFETELSIGINEYRQPTTYDSAVPAIFLDSFPQDNNGPGWDTGSRAELFMGPEIFRHFNFIAVDTLDIKLQAEYYVGDFEYVFGVDYQDSDFTNLFLEAGLGSFSFDSFEDYLLGDISSRSFLSSYRRVGVTGQDVRAITDMQVTGIFGQIRWDRSEQFRLTFGTRVDFTTSSAVPPRAIGIAADGTQTPFDEIFGIPNNATMDGEILVAPRLSFNYRPEFNERLQIRGGIGVFQGRIPGVWMVNSFTNNGETTAEIDFQDIPDFNFNDYAVNEWQPGIQFGDKDGLSPDVNVLAENLSLPWIIRTNLALDYELGDTGWTVTGEFLYTDNRDALYVRDDNLVRSGTGPDGRPIYDDRLTDLFDEVYVMDNHDDAYATNISIELRRAFRDNWSARFGYVRGTSKDANPFTSSRAVSNFRNRAAFDVNRVEEATSNFEIRDRIIAEFSYRFEYLDDWATTVTWFYEGRSGRPYSVVFEGDINGDDDNDNDLLYIPTGLGDPNVNFSDSFAADYDAFARYLSATGLDRYAGGVSETNSIYNPWVHRLDLSIVQEIPVWDRVGFEFYFNFINVLNFIDEDWGIVREFNFPLRHEIVEGSYDEVNNVYNFEGLNDLETPVQDGNTRSRWAIQIGAKLTF